MKSETIVKKNEIYNIEITAQGTEGEGIGRIDGFTVFVKGGAVGDKAKVKILKVNKSYAFAKIESITTPSPYRQTPPCPIYGKCGGCNFMHINYQNQLKLKSQRVYDALVRIGGFENIDMPEISGMKNPYEYRNKTQFPVGTSKDGRIITGFFMPRSHTIYECDRCIVSAPVVKSVTDTVKAFMKKYNVSAYDERTHTGIIRHIFVRTSRSGEVMAVIVTNAINMNNTDEMVDMLRKNVDGLSGVIQNINTDKTNLILGKNCVTLWGEDKLTDTIGDLKFEISPLSFFQINSEQTEVLYKKALEMAELTKEDAVFDLYCGAGTISLFMAARAKSVFGVEIVSAAVENARTNAKLNNITNAHFFCGDAQKVVDELYNSGERADVVVFDPPRKGSDEATLDTIIKMHPRRIVYVSCNPETLARDAKYLRENGGYDIDRLECVDMFPHTGHVESVARFVCAHKSK